jgi:hypothetical protein
MSMELRTLMVDTVLNEEEEEEEEEWLENDPTSVSREQLAAVARVYDSVFNRI